MGWCLRVGYGFMNSIMGYMLICCVCALYRCLKQIICELYKCVFYSYHSQVSTLTCITMDHNC